MPKVVVLPGDGIGQEIVPQALRVLQAVMADSPLKLEYEEHLVGGAAIDALDRPYPRKHWKPVKKQKLFYWEQWAVPNGIICLLQSVRNWVPCFLCVKL